MNGLFLMSDAGWGGLLAACIIGALILGFFGSRWFFKRELQKNPPINEAMIRAMYQSMGRKPSEADIQRTMAAIRRNSK